MSRYAMGFIENQKTLKTHTNKGLSEITAVISYHNKSRNSQTYLTRYLTRNLTPQSHSGKLRKTINLILSMKLTNTSIKALPSKKGSYYTWDDSAGRNTGRLGVKVFPSGKRTFYFRYFKDGKPVFIGLGVFPDVSLSDARTQAKQYSVQLSQGLCPKSLIEEAHEQKRQELLRQAEVEKEGSIQQLFEYYTSQMKAAGKRTYQQVLRDLEKEVYPVIPPETKAKNVKREQLVRVLGLMIQRGAKTQSNRVRSYLQAAFNAGLKHDNDPANMNSDVLFGIEHNLVTAIPRQANAERALDRVLTETELRDFVHRIKNGEFATTTQFACLLMLYSGGQRPFEVINSRWEHVDLVSNDWLIPASLSKNGKDHIVPITPNLKSLLLALHELTGHTPYLIPNRIKPTEPGRTDSLARSFTRYCEKYSVEKFTPRDIRRTCKTLMTRHNFSTKEIRDRLHNHALDDVSNKHYNRHDYRVEKESLLIDWNDWISRL
ncbi:tyrosine-type recombinase/integrase [Pseudidiomarina woesei]|uniref:Integrase n=1 Tax=Pseudidiomarina woesei TaxID=1381080 RepID=A0A0K6HA89_9GAMM|nr:site-specific integrase [Pseudidiomarina woesei]CUA87665.1 Integrase [Pseudidiomarina woesei]